MNIKHKNEEFLSKDEIHPETGASNNYTNLTEQEFVTLFSPVHTTSGVLSQYSLNTSELDEFAIKNVNPSISSHAITRDRSEHEQSEPDSEQGLSPQKIEKQSFIAEGHMALSNLEIHKASVCFRNARLLDMSDQALDALYTTSVVWIEKINEISKIDDPIIKGDMLFQYWFEFKTHWEVNRKREKQAHLQEEDLYRFKAFAISLAYMCFKHAVLKTPSLKNDLNFKLKIYRCLKLLKKFKQALIIIQGLCSNYSDSVNLYSELADCYYLNKNINYAKLLFREVFFKNPHEIVVENIEFPVIHDIIQLIKDEMKYSDAQIKFWIPVYGYIYHFFTISRELKPVEVHNLQNDISNMEAKLEDHKALGNDDIFQILPILLNKYFWLIDHYKKSGKIQDEHTRNSTIQLIYSKIKRTDPHIYKLLQEV